MIQGVKVKRLIIYKDFRGRVMEILRKDDRIFKKFGQVYMTTVKPNVVKAWHYHKKQIDNFTCIQGKVRLGLFDARKKSKTYGKSHEFIIDSKNPILVKIPNRVYHGFECISKKESIVINTSTIPYNRANPDECRIDPFKNKIPFKWKAKKGK